jgi:hypothetical protein
MDQITEQQREQLMSRATECYDVWSDIEEKIELARKLHQVNGAALLQDPSIHGLLEQLEQNLRNSTSALLELDIVETCKRCDEKEGGSCCGAGLENKFDVYLLLINLLLGVSLPDDHRRPDSCYFLTETGCMLKVRLFLCVDFLCTKILNGLTHEDLIGLQMISGEELVTGFKLYDAVKRFIRENTHPIVD